MRGFVNPRWVQKRVSQRAQKRARQLNLLCRESGPLVAPVTTESQETIIEAVVDSGAEDSVTPPGVFEGLVSPSPMSRAGRSYQAANGSPIANLGQMVAYFHDAEGRKCGIPFQVAGVNRPLISVSRLAAAGCRVAFSEDGGEILHVSSGRRLPLVRRGRVYILELRVGASREGAGCRRQPACQPFPRQGQ